MNFELIITPRTTDKDPARSRMENSSIDEFVEVVLSALKDSECGTSRSKNTGLNLINRKIRRLWTDLQLLEKSLPIGKKEVLVWILLEIIETDVGFSELSNWVNHEGTLDEIIFSEADDEHSISHFFRDKKFDEAVARYQFLVKKHL